MPNDKQVSNRASRWFKDLKSAMLGRKSDGEKKLEAAQQKHAEVLGEFEALMDGFTRDSSVLELERDPTNRKP